MSLKRTEEVPRMERVEFTRVGQIEWRTATLAESGHGAILRIKDVMPGALVPPARCLVSSDPAGDQMRVGHLVFRGHQQSPESGHELVFDGHVSEVAGDWLWAETVRAQESLADLARRFAGPTPPPLWPLGDLIGGGRRQ